MAVDKILLVGKHFEAQQLVRPFAEHLYAADDAGDVLQQVGILEPDLIVFDAAVPNEAVIQSIQSLRQAAAQTPVIVVRTEAHKHDEQSLRQIGALDIVFGYEDVGRLGVIIDRLAAGETETDDRYFVEDCPPSVSIVGKSQAIQRTLRMIRLVAQSACNPILIVGETGTGKELAAQAVHLMRHGSDSKFVAVNCAALTANLLESELFGHVKGAFTSADKDKIGLLELAGSGTIFLDEISEMPMELQAKLLRFLQERTFRKVGGTKDISCTATVIASSNLKLFDQASIVIQAVPSSQPTPVPIAVMSYARLTIGSGSMRVESQRSGTNSHPRGSSCACAGAAASRSSANTLPMMTGILARSQNCFPSPPPQERIGQTVIIRM